MLIMKSVVNGNVDEVGYIKSEKKLIIKFKGGGLYEYKDVSQVMHTKLMKAESPGSFLNKKIINAKVANGLKHDYRKLPEPEFKKMLKKKKSNKKYQGKGL